MPPWHHHQIYVWLITDLLSASQINVYSFPLFLKATYVNGELLTVLRRKIKGVLVFTVCVFRVDHCNSFALAADMGIPLCCRT